MIEPLVTVKQGILRGSVEENIDGGQYLYFRNIPYAQPPLGELRFKDPQPPKSWDGVRDSLKTEKSCLQLDHFSQEIKGEEDCLYLNVVTNSLEGKKPVMVWIHGGGFIFGHKDLSTPGYLLKHDIVFVSINYRLGILGFLNLDIEDCSGNQGLKDQVFALKWVQENIEAFGGDKNNVTIFGQSAGGASVHYCCISPLAKGLFHKAIIQSGVAINPWSYQFSNKQSAMKLAAKLGRSTSNSEELLEFLRTRKAREIRQVQEEVLTSDPLLWDMVFVPTVDDKSSNPFLPKPLTEMIKNGIDVPVLIGHTSHEGIIALTAGDSQEIYDKFKDNFEKYLALELKLDSSKVSEISNKVKNFYFKENSTTKEDRDGFIKYKSDILFVNGIMHIIDNQVQKSTPTYVYKFSHDPEFFSLKKVFKISTPGACHGDDMIYLFDDLLFSSDKLKKDTEDYFLMKCMTKIWTNFAKTGEPTPELSELITTKWYPFKADKKFCLDIKVSLTPIQNFEEESWSFWKSIIEKYKLF